MKSLGKEMDKEKVVYIMKEKKKHIYNGILLALKEKRKS